MNTSDKSDRRLLELAAKAAGAEYEWDEDHIELITPIGGGSGYWNPLESDGDALRLAVALWMYVDISSKVCDAHSSGFFGREYVTGEQGNRQYATRRAIVLCAAAIGAKKESA